MKRNVGALVIGAGPAGLAAAASIRKNGVEDILIAEREAVPGGVLLQCIHNGFGLQRYKEELTGPEYAQRAISEASGIETLYNTAVLKLEQREGRLYALLLSKEKGLIHLYAEAVVLAMGCRERSRGSIAIPGSRPAGIMTAGLAQKLLNIEGYLPGKEIVILGSGDIGLIMARRLSWEGANVKAVIEVQSYPGGLVRNVVQCLEDFDIPLYLSHTVTRIYGDRRIEAIDVSPVGPSRETAGEESFRLSCDTLLLSVGLIPENELSLEAGVELHQVTGGAIVDDRLMTSVPGIFACGNVLHVHDLVDYATEEAEICGKNAADFLLQKAKEEKKISVRTGAMIRYVLPMTVSPGKNRILSFRPLNVGEHAKLSIRSDGKELLSKKFRVIHPSSMIRISVPEIPEDASSVELKLEVDEV